LRETARGKSINIVVRESHLNYSHHITGFSLKFPNSTKFNFGHASWDGSAPDTAEATHSTPPDLLAGFGEREGKGERERRGERGSGRREGSGRVARGGVSEG